MAALTITECGSAAGTLRRLHSISAADTTLEAETAAAGVQDSIITDSAMRSGVSRPAADVKAPLVNAFTTLGCNVQNAKFVWKGRFCRGSTSSINFTEVAAVDRFTNAALRTSKGALCRLVRGPNPSVNAQRFGSCNAAPAVAAGLPVRVCGATGGNGNLGGVGTTPMGLVLPRVPLQPNEQVPSGVSLIEAARGGSVGNIKLGKTVVVAVVDSGVDATHPDLNYVGGKGFVIPSTAVPGDSADPASDLYGHGTHVAGIVGAENDNSGLVGVAPGVGIYSLKILDAQGVGSLSDAMDAVTWAAGAEGQAAGIRVINLSLAAAVDPAAADYADTLALVCDSFKRASNAGIIVAAAAGNYGEDIRGYLPAACPTVIAVTSMDPAAGSASSFSNFLAEPASAAEKGSVMAAPGNAINSTISYAREDSGYRELSGTSMASPHVAGVAAACIASGACAEPTGYANSAVLQAAARERLGQQPAYGYSNDARSTGTGKFYGNLVWAKW
ncbi:hypothetical protein OEZ85_010205 [Tetradesmus obliquus]|uniref:Peptidase S8/S53 domain-containing protein n=1 Tax=Tetradesmus obliquus TaxID=3088 RepID=A0ABY8TRB5_TETOB|nr:hypothetical protein OEZ85_010205 [Tetradesmus obliquus]